MDEELVRLRQQVKAEKDRQFEGLKALAYSYLREQEPEHNKLDSLPKAVLAEVIRELWRWKLNNEGGIDE